MSNRRPIMKCDIINIKLHITTWKQQEMQNQIQSSLTKTENPAMGNKLQQITKRQKGLTIDITL